MQFEKLEESKFTKLLNHNQKEIFKFSRMGVDLSIKNGHPGFIRSARHIKYPSEDECVVNYNKL
jgi:hypothetical protein